MTDIDHATRSDVGPATRDPRAWERLRGHLADPFFRNAYALIVNTGLTGLLGVAFWAIAARTYSDPDVGRASALISAMTLLSGVVAINLTGTLSRFIPESGRSTRSLIVWAYALSSAAVLVLAAGFLLTLDRWGPSFDLLRDPSTAAWFLVLVVAAGAFTVQDGVLIGLRASVWVPVENVLFGVAKIVLLVVLATGFPRDGVYLAWVIPMALLLLPVNALIFGRLVPRHTSDHGDRFLPPAPAQVGRFFAADYGGALFMFGAATLPPLLVAPYVEPYTFAYFYVAWIAGGMLNLIPMNLASSLTVEGVHAAHTLVTNCRAALHRVLGIMTAAAVGVALLAPYLLAVLGSGYVDAAPMLQALALAAVPRGVVDIWIGVLRAQSRTRQIARVQIASGGLAIAAVLVWVQVDRLAVTPGVELITGVGLAVLASQTAVALVVLPALRRFLRGAPTIPPTPEVPRPVRGDPAAGDAQPVREASGMPASGVPQPVREASGMPAPGDAQPVREASGMPDGSQSPRAYPLGRGRFGLATICLTSMVAVALFVLGLRPLSGGGADPSALNGYGLISVLPAVSLWGLALLTLSFVATLARRRPQRILLGLQLVATACCLHGVTALLWSLPRFPVTWIHLGFVDYISRTGTVAAGLDGRFSWPGFFGVVALWSGNAGWRDLVGVLELVPLVSNLLYLLPLGLLLSNLRVSWQAKWLAAWLFCVLNWIGQDYFSPQGYAYWLYLVFVACLVTWLRPGPDDAVPSRTFWSPVPGRRLRLPIGSLGLSDAATPGELVPRHVDPALRCAILLLVLGLFVVAAISHPLTPLLMLAACAGLVGARRCVAVGLPMLLTVVLAGWLSYMTATYWSGHLGELFGGVGDLRGNLATSIIDRTRSGAEHGDVVAVRIALALTVLALAVLGLVRRRRRAVDDRVVLVLLLAPLVVVGLGSYGGEIALRAYLFALPAVVVLVACAVFPEPESELELEPEPELMPVLAVVPVRRRPGRILMLGAGALVLVGAFLVARYGNEKYEMTYDGALAAVEHVYQRDGTPTIVSLADPPSRDAPAFMPVGYRDVERTSRHVLPAPRDPGDLSGLIVGLRQLGPGTYLVTSRSTEAYLEVAAGYPQGWGERFRAELATAPELRRVVVNTDAAVYTVRGVPGAGASGAGDVRGSDRGEGAPGGSGSVAPGSGTWIGSTPWTTVGVAFLAVSVAVLGGRELWRLRREPGRWRGARPVALVTVPLLLGLALVIIERLVLLA
ncbi:MAG: hypothetical protein ACRDRK_04145 [Pseudonocardia sp.]